MVDYRQKRIPYLPINLAIVSIVGSSYNVNYTKAWFEKPFPKPGHIKLIAS